MRNSPTKAVIPNSLAPELGFWMGSDFRPNGYNPCNPAALAFHQEARPAFGYPAKDRRVGAGGRQSRAIERCSPSFIPLAKGACRRGCFDPTTVAGFAASSARLPIVAT